MSLASSTLPRMPMMAANADPSFEVATVKPSAPDEKGRALVVSGDHFRTINSTLMTLIKFAYDVQQKQVIGGPDWIDSEKFDIDGKPDTPGIPNPTQLRSMVQKLLADRFQLKFHKEKKDLSAYVLTVAKDGQKMTKNTGTQSVLPDFGFRGLGVLAVRDTTMAEFAAMMQSNVMDRPVGDHTGLAGQWSFLLKWTPDESQFGGMGFKIPPPSSAADAPPQLLTAIQEQLGLKLSAEKTPVEVLVLDHVEKPSAN